MKDKELNQEGYLSKELYKISLSEDYCKLLEEAKETSNSSLWIILAERGRDFPSLVEKVSNINMNKVNSADIGTLISYFAYRNKSIEDIMQNVKYGKL